MALTLKGRWVGLLNVTWPQPVTLGDREQRLYQSLAKQAAMLLDNHLMLERLRNSLKETKDQSQLLQTTLDHIPVGVDLLDGTGQAVLGNAWLERMLGQRPTSGATAAAPDTDHQALLPGTRVPVPFPDLPSQRALRSGKTEVSELDFILPDGETRLNIEATGIPIHDETGALKRAIVVFTDLTARKQAERARLQDEVIRVQAAALAERSSPLIPISEDILVLPLIGSIDTERSQQILETVLEGSSQTTPRRSFTSPGTVRRARRTTPAVRMTPSSIGSSTA